MPLMRSWVESANNPSCPFPLNNLPYGVFSTDSGDRRCGVAIGDMILDLKALEAEEIISFDGALQAQDWNAFMALGKKAWSNLRSKLQTILAEGNPNRGKLKIMLLPQSSAEMHLPFSVTEFTDFYASRHHATNVGTMFRGAENALTPNWLHIPIGYNGRASSVVISGTEIRRPWGQIKHPDNPLPCFAPSERFDIELELGAIVGSASSGPLTVKEAYENIFGYVLLNDWSARDIQAWEYQPLGPFQSKATATSISPWIVTAEALEPFGCPAPNREITLLDHLKDDGPMLYDIDLEVTLAPDGQAESTIATTNAKELYYSAAQQLAHHTSSGCAMRVGDLFGSGTISGPRRENSGSLLELSWGGKEPISLSTGETRGFIEDGDTLTLKGEASGDGYKIGFGSCSGKVLPALEHPYSRDLD